MKWAVIHNEIQRGKGVYDDAVDFSRRDQDFLDRLK